MAHTARRFLRRKVLVTYAVLFCLLGSSASSLAIQREVRGTWLTTTANTAISSSENTEQSMRRIKEIGLNTVYVESWKNGYTQFPSKVVAQIVHDQHSWRYLDQVVTISTANTGMVDVLVPAGCSRVELIVDRRQEMQQLQR
ncbi:MAG: family 10 glycosylhydrolase [Candidatus Aquirickettsiella gammari]